MAAAHSAPHSLWQRLAARLTSVETFRRLETDTRNWTATCPEGHVHDLWDLGGIRYKAHGSKASRMFCPGCGRTRWMRVARRNPG